MSTVPATKARRIGDILLELGFASEDALAKATIEQEKTGQPLGQILVDHGVITRLELASALAEQWSDQSASITLLPIPPPASAPRRAPEPHHDDDQYAARLQDAVAELAQRVGAGAAQPTEEFDDRVTDLAERVEATVARTQRIEATLATLAESFEGVTGGVEEAFGALQTGMSGLALDLARIDTTVAELGAARPEAEAVDPALAARLEELGAAVAALADRPVADPELDGRLDALAASVESLVEATGTPDGALVARIEEIAASVAALAERQVADPAAIDGRLQALAARVENIVTPDEVVALHESLVEFEQRLGVLAEDATSTDALDEQARSLAELRATVAALEARPVGDPGLDERLARIETQFAERLAAKPDSGEIDALADRLEAGVAEQESLVRAVAQLGVRLDEMTWRDDGATSRLEELQGRVEAVASALTEVRHGLAALEGLGATQQLSELGQSVTAMRDEVASLAQSITPADRIEQITGRLDELAAERDAQQALSARLDAIERTVMAEVVTPDDLARALAEARDDLTPAPAPLPDPRIDDLARDLGRLRDGQGPDPRVEYLTVELAEIRARLAEVSSTPDPVTDPAVHAQLEALALRIGQLGGDREQDASLAAKLDDLERRLPTEIVTPDELRSALARTREELSSSSSGKADPRIEQLAVELAALRDERTPDPRVDQLLDDLASIRQEIAAVRHAPAPTGDDSAVRSEIEALARRIEELSSAEPHDDTALRAKIEALEQRAPSPAEADPQVAQLAHDVETLRDHLAKVERTPATDPVVASELDTLSQRLRFLDVRVNEEMATSGDVTRAVETLRAELVASAPADTATLESAVGSLAARLDGLAEAVATGTAGSAGPAAEELQRLVDERVEAQLAERVAEQVAQLTRGLEERLAVAEGGPRSSGVATGDTSGLEDLLERNRMTIERLGLHLGEHDRALAELMRSRNLPKKLDELAARVDELAGGAPSGAPQAPGTRREIGAFSSSEPSTGEVKALQRRVEDAEIASAADREKLMSRLERMASSIDWRLQRLEAEETQTKD